MLATYYNLIQQKFKIGNKSLIITDVGGRTTDICLFENRKIKFVRTIPVGMLNVYKDIIDYINTTYTEDYKVEDGELISEGRLIS